VPACDPRCGGNLFAHVAYPRQLTLKADIIQDAFGRIGRLPLAERPVVMASPEHGYRMRARLHVRDGRIGFYLEGSHELCDATSTGQLLPGTAAWIARAGEIASKHRLTGLTAIELAENIAGDERACHLELQHGLAPGPFAELAEGLAGLSAQRADRPDLRTVAGVPAVADSIPAGNGSDVLRLRRDVRSFFQGNRFLVEPLVRQVARLVPAGPVIDLYAGVGLFGLFLAANGFEPVTLVEGDPVAGGDLEQNAEPLRSRVTVARCSVEHFLVQPPASRLMKTTRLNSYREFLKARPRGLPSGLSSAIRTSTRQITTI
jgi:23S rRNA (uracil1939-C5)-methyltransferase